MCLKLFSSLGMIDIHSIAHVNIIILFGWRRLGVLGLGYWDIIALSGSRRPGVSMVRYHRTVGGFGN
jgi:hypothetical protein